jgi:hypothetical protein
VILELLRLEVAGLLFDDMPGPILPFMRAL